MPETQAKMKSDLKQSKVVASKVVSEDSDEPSLQNLERTEEQARWIIITLKDNAKKNCSLEPTL